MKKTTVGELLNIFKTHHWLCTDSRNVLPGSIFFALKGDNFNGNVFALKALENGASYAVIDEEDKYIDNRTLLVDNVLESLQSLASLYRSQLIIPIIGITGTNGKTTTKELIATALSVRFNTIATKGNLNNHIGVPLTLLSIKPDTEIAVIEMGANHPGEIAALCEIARPSHGIITNIGKAHLEGFGGFEGVIRTKRELYEYLNKNGGTVFVNSGNKLLMDLSQNSYRVTYGCQNSDTIAGKPTTDENGLLGIELNKPHNYIFTTHLAGEYNFENVMAAMCIAAHFRVETEKSIEAISAYIPGMNRSQVLKTSRNTLILDAYNANPSSMKAAIGNFLKLNASQKAIILGDMFELGNESSFEHQQVIDLIKDLPDLRIYTAGPRFYEVVADGGNIKKFRTTGDLGIELSNNPPSGHTILVKGSRGMKLETITGLL
ncbi:MAG: UDP-N-acetylmuramoyl-tripeptide--D-alanyl-D-alanine ligase [Chloroflexota bacterium]